MRQPMGLAKCPTQSPVLASRKATCEHSLDRRVALNDSLIVRVEMALLTVGMSLAKCETVGGNQA